MLIVLKEFQNKLSDKSDPYHTFYFRTKLHVFLVNYLFLNMLDENEINFVKIFDHQLGWKFKFQEGIGGNDLNCCSNSCLNHCSCFKSEYKRSCDAV